MQSKYNIFIGIVTMHIGYAESIFDQWEITIYKYKKQTGKIGLHLSVVTYFNLKLCILVLRDYDFTGSKVKSQISLEIISIFKSFA